MGAIYSGSANNSRIFGCTFYTPYYMELEKDYIWLFVYSFLGTLFNH